MDDVGWNHLVVGIEAGLQVVPWFGSKLEELPSVPHEIRTHAPHISGFITTQYLYIRQRKLGTITNSK